MKILVTGATGFIGNRVVVSLLKRNITVVATATDSDKAKEFPWFERVQFIKWDINTLWGKSEKDCFSFFGSPSCMIHMAWEKLDDYRALEHFERIAVSHYRFLKSLVKGGLNHLVVAGTCLEYGLRDGTLKEDIDTKPVIPYALGKDTLRRFLEQMLAGTDVIFQWIRLFYLYGDHQRPSSLTGQIDNAIENREKSFNMSEGQQLRDYLEVDTAADYIVRIALQETVQGCINCCSGKPVSIRKFVEEYIEKRGAEIKLNLGYYPYPDYESMAFWGDIAKLKTILDQ